LEAMKAGDLAVFLSATVTPMEFEKHLGQHLAEAIAEGVANGGTYLYLRPTEDVIHRYYDSNGLWRLRRILQTEVMATEFSDFRANLVNLVRSKAKKTDAEARVLVERHT